MKFIVAEGSTFSNQIIDDILDIEGDQKLLGKKVGADSKRLKATYPAAVGIDQARTDAAELIAAAVAVIDNDAGSVLKEIALFIGRRDS